MRVDVGYTLRSRPFQHPAGLRDVRQMNEQRTIGFARHP